MPWVLLFTVLTAAACQLEPLTAPASRPGRAPRWGQAALAPTAAVSPQGGEPPGRSGTSWGGGDARLGSRLFGDLCVKCHGPKGTGGMVPMVGQVPDLTHPDLQNRLQDADVAAVVAAGKNKMPAFMDQLDGEKLRALVAYVRTLKR